MYQQLTQKKFGVEEPSSCLLAEKEKFCKTKCQQTFPFGFGGATGMPWDLIFDMCSNIANSSEMNMARY